jgi:hypothetical protein
MRCVHLNRAGEQCPDRALEAGQFCPYHSRIFEDEEAYHRLYSAESRSGSRYPLIYRIAAAVLLLGFALQAYQAIRSWLGV